MPLMLDNIDDFVTATLKNFKRNEWTDLSLEHTEYVSKDIITKKKVVERGGSQIDFKLQTKNTGNARNTGLFDQDVTNVDDVLVSAQVPWRFQTTNWSYDVREDLFQSDPETIIGELKVREHDAMNSMAELNEENLWTAPTGPSDHRPMGIPYWIVKDATTTPEGAFNGGNPSGFSAGAANVDSTTYTRWKNWTFGYTTVSPDDMIKKFKKALYRTTFMAPDPHPTLGYGGAQWQVYTTYAVREPLERLAESRNDNLGNDVAKYVNQVVIAGVPVKAVPYLDANDSSDPIYGINWGVFRPFVKKGWNMKRLPTKTAAHQRNVREVHYECAMNYCCYNRRGLFVGSTS